MVVESWYRTSKPLENRIIIFVSIIEVSGADWIYFVIQFSLSHHKRGMWKEKVLYSHKWKKKFSRFDECLCFVCLRTQNKQKKNPSVCLSGWLCVRVYARRFGLWTHTFEGVSGSKRNSVGVFYIWNVNLVLKTKVKSYSDPGLILNSILIFKKTWVYKA